MKLKDGYKKLIGTSYNGDASLVLLSNGGNLGYAISSTASTLVLRNANGLIESSLTDKAPFKVTSTVINTNLNADLLDGVHKEGLLTAFENINDTDHPQSIKLTVGDTTKYVLTAYSTNANLAGILGNSTNANYPLLFTSAVNTSTTNRAYLNIYTDTANSLYYNPSTNTLRTVNLYVAGTSTFCADVTLYKSDSGDSPRLIFLRSELNQTSYIDWSIYNTTGDLVFLKSAGNGWEDVFRIDYDTNATTVVGNSNAAGFVKSGSSDSYVLLGGGGHKSIASFQTTYDGRYVLKTGDTMTGTLAMSTGAAIHLWDDSATASHRLSLRCASDVGRIYNYTGSAYGAMYIGHDGTNAIVVTSGLNVGIGTGSPSQKLHVAGLVNITANSGTLTIGSLNTSYTHYSTTGGTHWFNKAVAINGNHYPHVTNSFSSGTSGYRWSNVYSVLGNFSSDVTIGGYAGIGSSLFNNNLRFNYGLAYYNTSTSTVTGTIVITLPNGWNASMNTYEIDIYEYNDYDEDAANILHSKIIISGYNYSTGAAWINYGYQQIGSYNKGVRLGYNGSKCCILLGTTTTTWSYPQVHLSRVITGFSNQTAWSTGYSISVITSESGYSGIVTANRTRQYFADVVANTFRGNLVGNATSATQVIVTNSDANSTYRMVWHSSNSLYSTAGIYCNPSTDCLYAAHYYETSDIRKKNILDYIENINLENIPIVQFKWKEKPNRVHIGSIAQEVEKILPEVVEIGEDGYKSIDYGVLGTVSGVMAIKLLTKLLEKIKELEKEIEILKNKN